MQNQADFHILGETADYLAVDKPAGLLVHPSKPGGPRTLWDGLRDLLGYELATGGQISIINRLDRETSGVVIVAKSFEAARAAGIAMQRREMKKRYLALVFGWPDWEEITIDTPICRRGEVEESVVWLERMVHPSGQAAVTRFRVLERHSRAGEPFALLEAEPLTGRTTKSASTPPRWVFPSSETSSTHGAATNTCASLTRAGPMRWPPTSGCPGTRCTAHAWFSESTCGMLPCPTISPRLPDDASLALLRDTPGDLLGELLPHGGGLHVTVVRGVGKEPEFAQDGGTAIIAQHVVVVALHPAVHGGINRLDLLQDVCGETTDREE